MYIEKIVTEEGEADSQESIKSLIKFFYNTLSSEKEAIIENDENYQKDFPQLSDEDTRNLNCEITLEELEKTLKECNDSAPGPDGIPYSIYVAGICRNLAFPEMPRQFRKWYLIQYIQNLGNGKTQKSIQSIL